MWPEKVQGAVFKSFILLCLYSLWPEGRERRLLIVFVFVMILFFIFICFITLSFFLLYFSYLFFYSRFLFGHTFFFCGSVRHLWKDVVPTLNLWKKKGKKSNVKRWQKKRCFCLICKWKQPRHYINSIATLSLGIKNTCTAPPIRGLILAPKKPNDSSFM